MSRTIFIVIPAKAGISPVRMDAEGETPAFAGVTGKGNVVRVLLGCFR